MTEPLKHPVLGEYHVLRVGAKSIAQADRAGITDGVLALIPVHSVDAHFLDMLLRTGSTSWALFERNEFVEFAYADVLAAHPGAIALVGYRRMALPSSALGLPDDVQAKIECDALTIATGGTIHKLKAGSKMPMRQRLDAAVRGLRVADSHLNDVKERPPLRVDPRARWILSNLTDADTAERVRDRLAELSSDEKIDRYERKIRINGVDVVGMPEKVELKLGADRLLRGGLDLPRASVNGSCVTLAPYKGPIPTGEWPASEAVDHPAVQGLTVRRVTKAKNGALVCGLAPVQVEEYEAAMLACRPLDDATIDRILPDVQPAGGYDPIARHLLSTMTPWKRLRRLVLSARSERDENYRRDDAQYNVAGGRLQATLRMSPSAIWRGDAMRIRGLPEAMMMKLVTQAVGRAATDIVDHPALAGAVIRSVHRTTETEYLASGRSEYASLNFHLVDRCEVLAQAA